MGAFFIFFVHGEAEFDASTFGGGAGFAAAAFDWGFEGAQAADFVENTLGFEFGFKAFECAVDGLSFFYGDFWHAVRNVGVAGNARMGI